MRSRERAGRIVLVSHNVVAIEQLCTTALWLDGGRTADQGPAHEVVERYNSSFAVAQTGGFEASNVMGDGTVELRSYTVTNGDGAVDPLPATGEDVLINVHVRVREPIQQPAVGVSIWSPTGVLLTSVDTSQSGTELPPLARGEHTLTLRLGQVAYLPGPHRVDFWIQGPGGHLYAHVEDSISFEIGQSPLYGTSHIDRGFGCVYTKIDVTSHGDPPGPSGEITLATVGTATRGSPGGDR